jgi:DNA-binding CsgD family transcriptional regulator
VAIDAHIDPVASRRVAALAESHGLSPSEGHVLLLMAADLAQSEIAERRHTSLSTVKKQAGAVRRKLGLRSVRDVRRRIREVS